MKDEITPEQQKLIDAVITLFDAADPAQKGTHNGFVILLACGAWSTFHAMCLSKYMEASNPLHDLAYAVWRLRGTINAEWKGKGAAVG